MTALASLRPAAALTAPSAVTPQPAGLLWLCVHLPALAQEVFNWRAGEAGVVVSKTAKPLVYAVTAAAARRGIAPGMTLPAAYALCPELAVRERNAAAEQTQLAALAECCLAYTDWVSVDFAAALLLEVRGSLTLFGGLTALQEQLRSVFRRAGQRCRLASAPTPLAAWLLAKNHRESAVTERAALRSALGDLPLVALPADPKTLERVGKTGTRTLRDLWRLPRDGLARRYGAELVCLLDQAAGTHTEPLQRFHAPPRFSATVELTLPAEQLDWIETGLNQLLRQFATFLTQRRATTSTVQLCLMHQRIAPTTTCLRLTRPNQQAEHWLSLFLERLSRIRLPAPVMALELSCDTLVPWQPECFDLFDPGSGEEAWPHVLAQIHARLGEDALRPLATAADHRPECAQAQVAQLMCGEQARAVRPLWLLPTPQPINPSALTLEPAVERIESGWWDEHPVRRDYHTATDPRGRRLWVFRELRSSRWFMHGLFG